MKRQGFVLVSVVLLASLPLACATATRTFDDGSGGDGGSGSGGSPTTTSSGILAGSSSSGSGDGGSMDICGDGQIGSSETCDPPAACPTACDDGDMCTQDALIGSPLTCNVVCMHNPVTTCGADGCCPAGCEAMLDPDCEVCGNGVVDSTEACDDANMDNTDACLDTCVSAACGDGYVWAGQEMCDDGNLNNGDGCSASCTTGGTTYGPVHTFQGKTSSFFMTQFGCSNSGGDPAGDAKYFCEHVYGPTCVAEPGYMEVMNSVNSMMHSGTNCYSPDPTGVPIPNTICIGGPCMIGDYSGTFSGLTNLVCTCN